MGLVLDTIEASVLIVTRQSSNGIALGIIVLSKPVLSSKPSGGSFHIVVRVSSKN
jgi:hypothetical protein